MFLKAIVICWLYFIGFCLSIVCRRLYTNETRLPVPFFRDGLSYSLAELNNGFLTLSKNQQVLLICPGVRNNLVLVDKRSNFSEVNTTCVGPNIVKINRSTFNINNILCYKTVKADVQPTKQRCDSGYIYKIGYNVTILYRIPLIEVCHVSSIGNTLYTKHILDASTLNTSAKITRFGSFGLDGMNTDIPISVSYKKIVQKILFGNQLFNGSSILAEKYINKTSYLARGHLTPHADFSMASSQASTYYFLNTAPTWQTLNTGIWKSVEHTVRKLSLQYGPLHIITGTFDILKYRNIINKPTDIYLAENQIPVPKYIWKIAFDPIKSTAIAFVMLNDPFVTYSPAYSSFCRDICRDNGFNNAGWKLGTRNLVWCCSYEEFISIVNYDLHLIVTDVLKFMKT